MYSYKIAYIYLIYVLPFSKDFTFNELCFQVIIIKIILTVNTLSNYYLVAESYDTQKEVRIVYKNITICLCFTYYNNNVLLKYMLMANGVV